MEELIQKATINIDLDKLNELVQIGARRASSFMMLGTTAAQDIKLSSVKSPSLLSYQFLPEPLPEPLSAQIGVEFKDWIAGCALREIEQHFSFFLDRVNEALTVASLNNTRVHSSFSIRSKSFELKNAADKFAAVGAKVAISTSSEKHLRRLSWARNVLSHRLGYVPPDYANADGKLVVSWIGCEIFLEGNGRTFNVPVESNEPFQAPPFDTQAFLKFVEKEKTFEVGSKIEISPFELLEICQFYVNCSIAVANGLRSLAESQGALLIKAPIAPATIEDSGE